MFLLAFAAVLGVDCVTKALVVRALAPGQSVPAGAWSPVRLRHLRNMRFATGRGRVLWLLGAVVAGGALLAHTVFADVQLAQVGLGLAVGGATGNARDIWLGRGVVDFVDVRVWPTFNVADAAITIGVVLTIANLF